MVYQIGEGGVSKFKNMEGLDREDYGEAISNDGFSGETNS